MGETVTIRECLVPDERAMERLGECVAAGLVAADEDRATVALEGDLGAGKTRFARGLAAGLGIDPDAVSSPSFVLSMEHRGEGSRRFVHVDAWRMRDGSELDSIGFDETLDRPGTVVAIEWASRIGSRLPAARVEVSIEHVDPERRFVRIVDRRGDAAAADRLARAVSLWSAAGESRPARCPTCGRPAATDAKTFPFCTPRCRLADLGRWMRGDYRIGRPFDPETDDEPASG